MQPPLTRTRTRQTRRRASNPNPNQNQNANPNPNPNRNRTQTRTLTLTLAGEQEIGEVLDARLNGRTGRQEYQIRWVNPILDDSWEPETVLKHAATALAEFLAKRARAAEAATTAADTEKARELKLSQAGFRQAWAQSVEEGAISVVRERFERIELKGVPVLVPPTAAPSMLDELHGALREIDPQYDPKFSSMKDLAKMPKLKALLEDEQHCSDSTYALDLHDCGDPSCQFGCSDWRTELKAEAAGHGCEPAGKNTAVVEPRSGILARGGRERKGRNSVPNGLFFF